jgi:hypothetical protein
VYLSFAEDRSIDKKNFGTGQKDRTKERRLWSGSVRRVKDKAKYAVVAANNYYDGFGRGTAN